MVPVTATVLAPDTVIMALDTVMTLVNFVTPAPFITLTTVRLESNKSQQLWLLR